MNPEPKNDMRNILNVTTGIAAFCAVSFELSAAQLAYDGFADSEYTLGAINEQAPVVSGFAASGWAGNGAVSEINLSYVSGSTLETTGYGYIRNNGAVIRGLDVSTTGPFSSLLNSAQTAIGGDNTGTVFGSFLLYSPNAEFSGFIELNKEGARNFRLGINNGEWSRRIGGGGWVAFPEAPAVVAGATNLVVYSINFDNGNERSAIEVWINPVLGAGTPTPTVSFDVGDLIEFDDVELALYFSEDALLDEVRFGESFADVTPTTGGGVGPQYGVFSSYAIVDGFADTGEWLGMVYVAHYPWVYVVDLGGYLYAGGDNWFYAPK
jgi:hypothetical protein